jgi:hypothetical protein
MRRYRRDAGLSLRIALSLVGLCLVYVPFAFWALGWVWFAGGLRAVGALAAIVVFLVLMRPLWIGRFGLLSVGRAPNPEEAQRLQPVVERLCGLADLPVPRVEVLDSELPTRSRSHALWARTRSSSRPGCSRDSRPTSSKPSSLTSSLTSRTATRSSW